MRARGWWRLRNVDGDPLQPKMQGTDRDTLNFRLDLGAQIIAVVPQPVQREIDPETKEFVRLTQARNQIEIYFNHDELNPASAANVEFYQLIHTNGTVSNLDDEMHTPISVEYDRGNRQGHADVSRPTSEVGPTNRGN